MSGYTTPLAKMRATRPAKAKPGGSNVLSDILSAYLNRQKALAQGGLDQANLGAQQLQNANPMGAANMVLGPLGYLASPVTALVPTDEEINASPDVPEWLKPGVRAVSKTGMTMLPIPGSNELGASAANLARTGVNRGVDVAAGAGDFLGRYIGAPAEAYMSGPGIKKPMSAADLAEVEKIRKRMRMFEDMPPVKEMSDERAAQLAAEINAAYGNDTPSDYSVPPMEDFLPKPKSSAAKPAKPKR